MRRLRNTITRAPLTCYFVLAFGMTWLTWLPYVLSAHGLGLLPWRFPEVLGSSQTLGMLPGAYLGPVTAAFAVTAIADGRAGLARWGRRLVRWRVGLRWYLFGLTAVPVVGIAATFAIPAAWTDVRLPTATALLLYLPVLALQIVTTAVLLLWPQIFPSLDVFRDSLHALTLGAGAAAVLLIVVTRGRLGLPPSTAVAVPSAPGRG